MERANSCPQFQFWYIILQLELYVMIYVRGKFRALHRGLKQNSSLNFALDHTHYARWIPVYLRDLVSLKECHPTIHAEFEKGNFTVKNLSGYSQLLLWIKPMSRIMHLLKVMEVH